MRATALILSVSLALCSCSESGSSRSSRSGNTTDETAAQRQLTSEERLAAKVALAREMSDFASKRADENRDSATANGQREMLTHLEKYSNYSPITGSGVRQKHEEHNAILQRQAEQLNEGVVLNKATLPLLQAAEKALTAQAGSSSLEPALDDAIRAGLDEFRRSPIISKGERLQFERQWEQLNSSRTGDE